MYEKNPESEIVIKITPRNLERLIYILIIIGLVIFSIVEFNKKIPDCPAVNCTSNQTVQQATPQQNTPAATNTPTTNTATNTTLIQTTVTGSGKVDFLLSDATLCIVNQTEDKGRFDTVSIYIKNGLSRTFSGTLDLYEWDSNDDNSLQITPSQKVEKIKILSGNTLTHTYTIAGGMFTELDKPKTVKVTLIDTDLNTIVGTETKTSVSTTKDCQ
jgi:hypothetical protein